MNERITIDTATAAQFTGQTDRWIRERIASGALPAEAIPGSAGQGGISYRIPLDALPAEAQIRYWEQRGHDVMAATADEEAFDLGTYKARQGEAGLEELLNRQQAVLQVIGLRDRAGKGLTEAINGVAERHGMSGATLRRLEERYRKQGLAGLTRSGRNDKGESRSMCLEARRRICADYLDAGLLKANTILDRLFQFPEPDACAHCPYNPESAEHASLQLTDLADAFPPCGEAGGGLIAPNNRHAVNRVIAQMPDEDKDYMRRGRKYWEARYMMKGIRKKPDQVNEGWFGDHHQFDVFVLDERGKPVRPWLTAWYDIGSGMLVGWCISTNPNSGTITEALVRGIAKKKNSPVFGAPVWCYMDNGKDYRSRHFEGDEETEYWMHRDPELMQQMYLKLTGASVMQTLRIKAVHAKAYHGWAKPVERFFRTLEERYCRQLRGYCGGKPEDRAENFDRSLRAWVEKGELMTMDEFVDVFQNEILPAYNQHPHEGYGGETPAQRYARLPKARFEEFSWALLSEVRMQEAVRVVTPQGIKFRGRIYWDEALIHLATQRVVIKFNNCEMDEITVRRITDGGFICEAAVREAFQYVGEDEETIARHVSMQKRQETEVRQRIAARTGRRIGRRASGNLYHEAVDETAAGNITSLEAETTARRRGERRKATADAATRTELDDYFYQLGLQGLNSGR